MALNHKAYEFRGNSLSQARRAERPGRSSARSRRSNPICRSSIRTITCGTTKTRGRYLIHELVEDVGTGHNIVATVFIEAGSMYRADGPDAMKPVGEVEFVNGIAAMSASGRYGKTRLCAGIIGHADLTLGDRVQPVLEALIAAGNGRFRGIRHGVTWDTGNAAKFGRRQVPPHQVLDPVFRKGFARLQPLGLSFEAWLFHPQLPDLVDLLRAFPDTNVILNHVGGLLGIPPHDGNRDEVFEIWRGHIRELAQFPNLSVKVGGLGMLYLRLGFPPARRSAVVGGAGRRVAALCRDLHRGVRRQPLHDGKQLPGGQAIVRLWRAVERVEADHAGLLGGGEGGAVSRHRRAGLSAGGLRPGKGVRNLFPDRKKVPDTFSSLTPLLCSRRAQPGRHDDLAEDPIMLRMIRSYSSGVVGAGSKLMATICFLTSGSSSTLATSLLILFSMWRGVPAGASNPCVASRSNPGSTSVSVGTSGSSGVRFLVTTASATQPPVLDHSQCRSQARKAVVDAAGHDLDQHFGLALESHVHGLDAGDHLESLGGHVYPAARAGRAEEDLAGPLLRERDQLLDRLDAQRWRHGQRAAGGADLGDADEILERVVRTDSRAAPRRLRTRRKSAPACARRAWLWRPRWSPSCRRLPGDSR